MYFRLRPLIYTLAWIGLTLLWISIGRHPIDRELSRTGARELISSYCVRARDCTAVTFVYRKQVVYPVEPVYCRVEVMGTSAALAQVRRLLYQSLSPHSRQYFTVASANTGAPTAGGHP